MGRFRIQTETARSVQHSFDTAGSSPYVLSGRIVTMDAGSTVHPAGFVCVKGNAIAAVAPDKASIPAEFAGLTPIETKTPSTIYPGLIELHNHLGYNMLPLWDVPQRYTNRNIWRSDFARYLPEVSWPAIVLGKNADRDYRRAIARFVECRSLFGGVTTAQGLSSDGQYYKGLVRNVEDPADAWPKADGAVPDYRPEEIEKLWVALQEPRPYFYHLSEGTDSDAHQRFLDLDLGAKGWAINQNLIAIHCVALGQSDLQRLTAAAGMVWSPLSNFLLYGTTADVEAAKALGVKIALGSDWSPSGSKNLLGELKVARIASDSLGGVFSDEELARMVTANPARMLGWDPYIGSIEAGKRADLLVLANNVEHPYAQLINARENQIMAVIVDGRPRLGREHLLDFAPDQQETVTIGGWRYTLDLAEDSGQTLGGLSLASATAKLAYGMQHLPELARDYVPETTFLVKRADENALFTNTLNLEYWGIDLEFEPELITLRDAMEKAPKIDPVLIKRLELPPLTEIDDPYFRPRLRANVNLPDGISAAALMPVRRCGSRNPHSGFSISGKSGGGRSHRKARVRHRSPLPA